MSTPGGVDYDEQRSWSCKSSAADVSSWRIELYMSPWGTAELNMWVGVTLLDRKTQIYIFITNVKRNGFCFSRWRKDWSCTESICTHTTHIVHTLEVLMWLFHCCELYPLTAVVFLRAEKQSKLESNSFYVLSYLDINWIRLWSWFWFWFVVLVWIKSSWGKAEEGI